MAISSLFNIFIIDSEAVILLKRRWDYCLSEYMYSKKTVLTFEHAFIVMARYDSQIALILSFFTRNVSTVPFRV